MKETKNLAVDSISNIRNIVSMFDIEHPMGRIGALHQIKKELDVSTDEAMQILEKNFL